MPERFLVLQSSYKILSIGLCEQDRMIDCIIESKLTPSASLVPHAIELLKRNNLTLDDISAIFVNQGPGAFGSLRVLLSTANGLSFAKKLPLIGVDGLMALGFDVVNNYTSFYPAQDKEILLVTLLNAYNVECYFGLFDANFAKKTISAPHDRGYAKVYTLLETLREQYPEREIVFVGNGVELYGEMIKEKFGNQATLVTNHFDLASVDVVAFSGYQQWQQKPEPTYKLLPLYLKNYIVATAGK